MHVVDRRIEDAVGPGTRRGTQRGFWRFAKRLKRIYMTIFRLASRVRETRFLISEMHNMDLEMHNMHLDPSKNRVRRDF